MNPSLILEIIAANRHDLMLNSTAALKSLAVLHKDFDKIPDEACILSLALNDSIARMLFYADYDQAITISGQILERFPDSEERYFISRHLGVIGRCLALSGKHPSAHDTLIRALRIAEKELDISDETIRHRADILHDLAMNNDIAKGDQKKSILYLGKALTLLADTTFEIRKGICLMGLGNVRYTEGKKKAALKFYLRAAKIFETQASGLNLAASYSNIGLCYSDLDQLGQVEKYLNKSLDLRLRSGNNDNIANSYFNLAKFHDRQDNIEETYTNMLACRDYAIRSVNKKLYIDALLWLESLSLKRNDKDNALLFRDERQKADMS